MWFANVAGTAISRPARTDEKGVSGHRVRPLAARTPRQQELPSRARPCPASARRAARSAPALGSVGAARASRNSSVTKPSRTPERHLASAVGAAGTRSARASTRARAARARGRPCSARPVTARSDELEGVARPRAAERGRRPRSRRRSRRSAGSSRGSARSITLKRVRHPARRAGPVVAHQVPERERRAGIAAVDTASSAAIRTSSAPSPCRSARS